MFKNAIKSALYYIKPLATGKLVYKDFKILNTISTMVVLNKKGDILTTKNVAILFEMQSELRETYIPILKELMSLNDKKRKKIEDKYGIKDNTIIEIANIIVDIVDNPGKIKIIKHKYLNLAVIRIENCDNLLCSKFPIFNKKYDIGEEICNVGFAYPEYEAFLFNEKEWNIKTDIKKMNFPIFPTNGMIARNLRDIDGNISMFESTSAFINGQQGGVVLNKKGNVVGLISDGFIRDNINISVIINSDAIISFLKANKIYYDEVENGKINCNN